MNCMNSHKRVYLRLLRSVQNSLAELLVDRLSRFLRECREVLKRMNSKTPGKDQNTLLSDEKIE